MEAMVQLMDLSSQVYLLVLQSHSLSTMSSAIRPEGNHIVKPTPAVHSGAFTCESLTLTTL